MKLDMMGKDLVSMSICVFHALTVFYMNINPCHNSQDDLKDISIWSSIWYSNNVRLLYAGSDSQLVIRKTLVSLFSAAKPIF